MQPVHTCSQDCETLHKEISKKILLILVGSRSQLHGGGNLSKSSNNWFGLETPFGGSNDLLQGHEEAIKSFLATTTTSESKEIKFSVYLDNEDGLIGIEDGDEGKVRKEAAKKGKFLLELWTIKFHPKCIVSDGEEEIRKLYKRTSLFVRSLYAISRLLPVYPLIKQKLPIHLELSFVRDDKLYVELCESLLSSSQYSESFESIDRTELTRLQTNHGDVTISVRFKKISVKFYTIVRSPAIRVPDQVIKAKDIQIKSSPVTGNVVVGSGDWVDMSQKQQASLKQNKRNPHNPQTPTGQIKILTTAHKASSSLVPQQQQHHQAQQRVDLSEFIKIFEKIPPSSEPTTNNNMTTNQLIQLLEIGRSKKIHFDRWLEELEIEHEITMTKLNEFDLINNME